jgi:tetratricopeptide (TPR) repeat protein
MPGVPTEIVHLAFTHHRIGIHQPAAPRQHEHEAEHEAATTLLEPWHDLSRVGEIDRIRSLGLAYYDRGFDPGSHSAFCFDQARNILEEVRSSGLREGSVSGALAQVLGQMSLPQSVEFAREALADRKIPAAPRIRALFILATDRYRQQHYAEAIELAQEITRLRRCSSDWALLGYCRLAVGDSQAATADFEKALDLNPRLLPIHRELAKLYEAAGHGEKAARRRQIGERFRTIAAQNNRLHP